MKGVKIFELYGSGQVREVGRFWLEGDQLRASPKSPTMDYIASLPIIDYELGGRVTALNGARFLHNLQFAYRGRTNAGPVAELDDAAAPVV